MADDKKSSQTGLTYHLVITKVAPAKMVQAKTDFARTFNLSAEVAEQILKSPPVVFLTNLSRTDVKTLKPKLLELSKPDKAGIEFAITPTLSPTLPHVIWPSQPQYKEGPAGELIQYVDFQWRGNAFVCPNCGETFVFQRVGNPFNTYRQVKEQSPALTPTVVEASEPAEIIEPMEVNAPEEAVAVPVADEPVANTAEATDEPVQELQPVEEGVMELKPIESQPEEFVESDAEPIDILAPAEEAAENAPAAEAVEAPAVVEEPVVEEAVCNVFLSGLSSTEKRDAAAKVIAEIKGIPLEKARDLAHRVLVPILKDVTESEAQECLERFKKIGISGRITKK